MPTETNRTIHEEIVNDISGCGGKAGEPDVNGGVYCLLRDLLLSGAIGFNDRTLEQMACVKRFKFERGITGKDGGWKSAWEEWTKERNGGSMEIGKSYAETFAKIYQPGMKAQEIYAQMFPAEQSLQKS